jgi:signal transduction histidine kinase
MQTEATGDGPDRTERKRIIFKELRRRSRWFVRLRWLVPPAILAAVGVGVALRYEFALVPIVIVAAGILVYNLFLAAAFHDVSQDKAKGASEPQDVAVRRFTAWQTYLDYTAVLALVYFTGGVGSPLLSFFLFHIICASILLPRQQTFLFAGLAVMGVSALALLQDVGWLAWQSVSHAGVVLVGPSATAHTIVVLVFFAASALITAYLATSIMVVLRARIHSLGRSFEQEQGLNEKLNALYEMVQTVLSRNSLDDVLVATKTSLTHVMAVKAVSIKLLGDSGRLLRYAAVQGLPESLISRIGIELSRSPLNRRIVEGEPFVTGDVSEKDKFQFGEDLAAAGFRSVLFVPLRTEHGVIGILGAYCEVANRFDKADVSFFRLVADLVAISIESARSYDSVERLLQDRSRFMLRVAHNIRTPLSAVLSMLELLRGSYLGEWNQVQGVYLQRIARRVRNLVTMISELLALAENRSSTGRNRQVAIELAELLARIRRTFEEDAVQRGIALELELPGEPIRIFGDPDLVEQLFENLVSNALKYTAQGSVRLRLSAMAGKASVEVQDTGIGIPADAMVDLFHEFFRAENAREMEELGTGLGLAIAKQIVDLLAGRIEVESEPGRGSKFTVQLPLAETEVRT